MQLPTLPDLCHFYELIAILSSVYYSWITLQVLSLSLLICLHFFSVSASYLFFFFSTLVRPDTLLLNRKTTHVIASASFPISLHLFGRRKHLESLVHPQAAAETLRPGTTASSESNRRSAIPATQCHLRVCPTCRTTLGSSGSSSRPLKTIDFCRRNRTRMVQLLFQLQSLTMKTARVRVPSKLRRYLAEKAYARWCKVFIAAVAAPKHKSQRMDASPLWLHINAARASSVHLTAY